MRFYNTKWLAVFLNVISMSFAVLLCYSVWCLYIFLYCFAVFIPPPPPSFMVPFSSEKTIILLFTQALGGYLLSNKGINTPLNWASIPLKGEGSKVLESAIG